MLKKREEKEREKTNNKTRESLRYIFTIFMMTVFFLIKKKF